MKALCAAFLGHGSDYYVQVRVLPGKQALENRDSTSGYRFKGSPENQEHRQPRRGGTLGRSQTQEPWRCVKRALTEQVRSSWRGEVEVGNRTVAKYSL